VVNQLYQMNVISIHFVLSFINLSKYEITKATAILKRISVKIDIRRLSSAGTILTGVLLSLHARHFTQASYYSQTKGSL
jgi:hypothetical protein